MYYLNDGRYGSFRIFLQEPVPRMPIVVKVGGPCVALMSLQSQQCIPLIRRPWASKVGKDMWKPTQGHPVNQGALVYLHTQLRASAAACMWTSLGQRMPGTQVLPLDG